MNSHFSCNSNVIMFNIVNSQIALPEGGYYLRLIAKLTINQMKRLDIS